MMDRGTVTMVSVHVVRDGVHVKRESLRLKGGEGENDECRKAPAHLPSLWEPAWRVNAGFMLPWLHRLCRRAIHAKDLPSERVSIGPIVRHVNHRDIELPGNRRKFLS